MKGNRILNQGTREGVNRRWSFGLVFFAKETLGHGDQVLVLEFCHGQWGMKRRGRQREKLGCQKLRWKKKKRRGRGHQVLVLEFCHGQWGMKRRGRQREKLGCQKLRWKKRGNV